MLVKSHGAVQIEQLHSISKIAPKQQKGRSIGGYIYIYICMYVCMYVCMGVVFQGAPWLAGFAVEPEGQPPFLETLTSRNGEAAKNRWLRWVPLENKPQNAPSKSADPFAKAKLVSAKGRGVF